MSRKVKFLLALVLVLVAVKVVSGGDAPDEIEYDDA